MLVLNPIKFGLRLPKNQNYLIFGLTLTDLSDINKYMAISKLAAADCCKFTGVTQYNDSRNILHALL